MKKDMIFFTNVGRGLTSTSANHIANLAKEMIRNTETSLEEMTFYSTHVALIGGDKPNVLNRGVGNEEVAEVIPKLHKIADAKSLIAWLREAIKAKERLMNEVKNLTLQEYADIEGIKLREQPVLGAILTEDEYFAGKPIGERCRYYELETLAATIGKAIHPDGVFADARKELQTKATKPHTVEGTGRDTLIYTYTSTVDESVVEDVYFRLQKQYREAQAQLNTMKHECQEAIEESSVDAKSRYTQEMADWTNERKLIEARKSEYVEKKLKDINDLRIIIPESLSEIYSVVSDLGKA